MGGTGHPLSGAGLGVGLIFTVSLPLKRAGDPGPRRATDDLLPLPQSTLGRPRLTLAWRRSIWWLKNAYRSNCHEGMLELKGLPWTSLALRTAITRTLEERHYDLIPVIAICGLDRYQTYRGVFDRRRPKNGASLIVARRMPVSLAEDRQGWLLQAGMDDDMSKPVHMETLCKYSKMESSCTP